MLFHYHICCLKDWGNIFQNKDAFLSIIQYICEKHGISFSGIDNCTPGSNAVFRVGNYIIKIFAPEETGIGGENDFRTEKFGLQRANRLNILTPRLFAADVLYDTYTFRYLILEYIKGVALSEITSQISAKERYRIGKKLRYIVDKMDTPCESFNTHRLFGKFSEKRWSVFPTVFQNERNDYLDTHKKKPSVFVHGDLNPDNILVCTDGKLCIIDFADAMIAPIELETAAILCDGFQFNPDYLNGFAGKYEKDALVESILFGLLIHDYGVNIIRDNIGNPHEFYSIAQLRSKIFEKI